MVCENWRVCKNTSDQHETSIVFSFFDARIKHNKATWNSPTIKSEPKHIASGTYKNYSDVDNIVWVNTIVG